MEIREIAINHYGPLRDVRHQPKSGLQVFFGPNESGKTLLIDAILKLMLGNRLRDFIGIDRVPNPPQGRITLAVEGKEHILDGGSRLDQVTGLDSHYLRNVFVIRNKDLQMTGQTGFLRKVSDQLTGMEGQRLSNLKQILQKQGRLTNPTSAARLSKSAEYNKIGEHVERAEELAEDIRQYLEAAREQKLDSLEGRLEDTRLLLAQLNSQIKAQESAEKRQSYEELVRLVDEYEEREQAARSLQRYTQRTFLKLQDLESRAQTNRETALASQRKLDLLLPRWEEAQAKLAEAKAKYRPLEERKPRLDQLEQRTLLAAGSPPPAPPGLYGRFSYALLVLAGLSILLAAVDKLPSLLLAIPFLSLAGAVFLLYADRSARNKVREHRHRDKLILQEGAASRIMAGTLQELAAAVSTEKFNLEENRTLLHQLEASVREMQQDQQYFEDNLRSATATAEKLEQQLKQDLQELGVSSLEQFGKFMEKYNQAQTQCDELHQRLEEALGQIPPLTGDWRTLLNQVPSPANPGVAFDRSKLNELRQQKDTAQEQIEAMQSELHRHQATLTNFAAACQSLPLADETNCTLPARFANLEVLDFVSTQLLQFADSVRQRFTAACKALAILEELELEEQEKMADLVGPGKPVQTVFRRITGGRYTDLGLDSELNIQVQNRDGLTLPAQALSQGTYDQLYLALRLSLAQDILAGEPGFLLLDDAFLCADSHRLERMLEELARQAAQGWQILYFTMDDRLAQAASRYTENTIIELSPLLP